MYLSADESICSVHAIDFEERATPSIQRRISRRIAAFVLYKKVLEHYEIQKKNLTRVFKFGKFHKRAFIKGKTNMPKFGGFLGFNTGLKVCAGVAVGYAGTIAMQHWHTSESSDNVPPLMREERDERQKKFEFEVQQRSEQLNKKEQTLKALEETLAKREAALKEERSTFQYMQAKNNAPSESETVAVQRVREEVPKVVESTTVKVAHPDPVAPPSDYGPRRPQVFDGGGNREPVAPTTIGVTRPLYFSDPSFATVDGRYNPTIPRGDTPPHLADTGRRRYTNLESQRVVSFRATKDGWSLVTPDGVRDGAYAPATGTDRLIASTASGAPRKSEKGDATVVTLHGDGPKPPSDGRSAVAEAERNAFNKERQAFAQQKEAFEREKSKKEKELADKQQALDDREAELDLRDNAADLFDLEDRETQYAKRQKAKYKVNTKVQQAENFDILRQEKTPYEIKQQNEGGMTIKAKSKEPNKVQINAEFLIAGKKQPFGKQPFENLELKREELFVPRPEKEPLKMSSEQNLEIFPQDMPKKTELFIQNTAELDVKSKPKQPNKKQCVDNLFVNGDEWQAEHVGFYEKSYAEGLAIIPEGRHPGDNVLSVKKIENSVKKIGDFQILSQPKARLLQESRDGIKIEAKQSEPLQLQRTNNFLSEGREGMLAKDYKEEKSSFSLMTEKKAEKANVAGQVANFTIADENVPVEGEKKTQDSGTDIANVKLSESLLRLRKALKTAKKTKEAADKNKDVKKTGKGLKKSTRKKLKLDVLSESTQTDLSMDEPLLSISKIENIVTFEGEKSFGNLEKASDFVRIPAKPKETSSVIAGTGRVFLKAKKIETKEEETAVGTQAVDFDSITENNFSVPGQVKAPLKTCDTESMIFSALGKPDNKVSSVDIIGFAGEEPKKTENAITSDRGFKIQAKPSAKVVKPSLTSQQFNFSLLAEKKVDPTVTDTFETPSKKKDNAKVKTKKSQTKRKRKKRDLLNSYDWDGLLDDYIEEDEESEKEENVPQKVKEVSAFALDGKPVAENKISKTESIQILQKKEKPQLISTKIADVEVKATKKQPPNLEISKMQITAEAQAVETKENATEPQKLELSIASNTAVFFEKTALPKKEFTIDGPSQLSVAAKKTEKANESVGTEPPQFEIAKTDFVIAEAKKVEKQEIGTAVEAPTPSVIAKQVSFGYSTKPLAKPLSVQNNDNISLTGEKSFGELQKDTVEESMRISAEPKPTLEIGKQQEALLFEAQPKPESEIHSVEAFNILRQEKPENQISSQEPVEVLPKPKPMYVKTNRDSLSIEGNDAWRLQLDLEETKAKLEAEKEELELLKIGSDVEKTLQQAEKARTFDDLQTTNAVSESVLRTKDTRGTEEQTAEKVPLFKEKNELFIKGEKPSKDWIIDDLDGDELDKDFENIKGKEKPLLRERQHEAMADIVRIWVRSYISDKHNTESVVSKIFEGKDKETKEVKEKLEKIEEKLLLGNDKHLTEEVREIITQYISSLNDTPIDVVETPKVVVVNKKPGWSVLEIQPGTAVDTFKGNVQSKFLRELYPSERNEICFIGKSAVTMDSSAQADESRRFLGNLCSGNVMKESFVDDKLSLVSRLTQKKLEHEKLNSDYEDLQKNAKDMLDINNEYHNENEKIKIINREQNQKIEALEKRYETLLKEFEEFRNLVGTGCGYSEFESEKVLSEAKVIALEAMEGITDGTLRGEEAERLLKKYGEKAGRWSSAVRHKCDNPVCLQRQRFMDSLAFLLQSRLGNRGADAFKAIQAGQLMIKGGVSKTSKPFEVIPMNSFGLDVDLKIKSEKEAQKEQLSKLTTENEALKSRLKEELDRYNITKKTNDDTEPLKKENNDLKEKSKAFEKENNNLKAKVVELQKENKDLEERLKAKENEVNFWFKDVLGTVGKENTALRKDIEQKEAIIAQQNADLKKQNNENTLLKLQNLIYEPDNLINESEGEPTDNKKNAEKKEDEEKKFKKPTDQKTAKEVDDFRKRLENAGDNLEKLKSLQKELEKKQHLKQWVSDGLKKAIKDAKEREEKYKKEEEEAEREMNNFMRRLEDIEDVDELKKGIAKLLDYAQDRLSHVPVKFGLEAAGSFVKGSFVGDIGRVCGDNAEQIAQKNVAKSLVNTVSSVQENIMKVWKRMTVILKPKALPMEDLKKATADEEQEKINREAERRKQKAVDERDKEIKNLKDQLKETERKYKVEVFELKNRLHASKSHMRGRTEVDLSSKKNGSSFYNLTEISELDEKKGGDNGRYSTPSEAQGKDKNKLRNGFVQKRDSYSRDSSRSLMRSKTRLEGFEKSNSRFEKYQESQMKLDNIWNNSDVNQRMSFTEQKNDANILGSILETKDDTSENILDSEWLDLQKERRQLITNLTAYLSKKEKIKELTWDEDLMDQVIAWKKQSEKIFLNIGKNNRMPVAEQKTIKPPSTPKVMKKAKTASRLLKTVKTEKKQGALKRNLGTAFCNEQSGLKSKKGQNSSQKRLKSKK